MSKQQINPVRGHDRRNSGRRASLLGIGALVLGSLSACSNQSAPPPAAPSNVQPGATDAPASTAALIIKATAPGDMPFWLP